MQIAKLSSKWRLLFLSLVVLLPGCAVTQDAVSSGVSLITGEPKSIRLVVDESKELDPFDRTRRFLVRLDDVETVSGTLDKRSVTVVLTALRPDYIMSEPRIAVILRHSSESLSAISWAAIFPVSCFPISVVHAHRESIEFQLEYDQIGHECVFAYP